MAVAFVNVTSLLKLFIVTILDVVQHLLMIQQLGCIQWTGSNVVFVSNVVIGHIPPNRLFICQVGPMLCLWHNCGTP